MGADRNQWQFPRNRAGGLLGWRDDGKGMENKVIGEDIQEHSDNLDELAAVTPGEAGKDVLAAETLTEAAAAVGLPPIAADRMLVDNPSGDARESKTFAEVRTLLGVPWLNETAEQEFAGPLQFPITPYLSLTSRLMQDVANGLEITPFHFFTGDVSSTNNSPALQNAVDFCFGTFGAPNLNLSGRNWPVAAPITYTSAPQAQRRIHNGRISATSSFSGGYVFDFQPSGEDVPGNRLNGLRIDHVTFNGGGALSGEYATSAIYLGKTQGVYIENCIMQFFSGAAIHDTTARAATEVVVSLCHITGRGVNSEGVRLAGYDSEVRDCIIRNSLNGVVALFGAAGIIGNHIYDCTNSSILDNGGNTVIVGNYIDNGPVILRSLNNQVLMSANKFLAHAAANYPDNAFIVAQPTSASSIADWLITNNTFEATVPINMTGVNTSLGGSVTGASGLTMLNNRTHGLTLQSSEPRAAVSISAASSASFDFGAAGRIPFGLTLQSCLAEFERATGGASTPACFGVIPTSNNVSAVLTTSSTGKVKFKTSVNSSYE